MGMGISLVVIVLISGYLFSYLHLASHYKLTRTEGWHSYFYVAARGLAFAIVSIIIYTIVDYYDLAAKFIQYFGWEFKDFNKLALDLENLKQEAWAVITVLLAAFFGLINRIYYKCCPQKKAKKIQKIVSENHLEKFIVEASYAQSPIALSLSSRKVYVGFCLGDELINSKIEHIAIIPILSGYRDKDSLSIEITNNYKTHYIEEGIEQGQDQHRKLNKEDFRVIVPTSEIETFSFFDIGTYVKFKKKEHMQKRRAAFNNAYTKTQVSHASPTIKHSEKTKTNKLKKWPIFNILKM
jgi:hypothetical protein